MLVSLLLTLSLMSASMPEGCAVTGTVFHSTEQTFALLHSNCLIEIQRRDRWIIMTSPQWVVAVEIPPMPGKCQFTYTWARPGLCLERDRRLASGCPWQWGIKQVCSARSHGLGRAGGLAQEDLGGTGDQQIQDRPDFRVAIPLVKPPGQVIEVGHAYEEVLGPAKDHALQMGQERSAIPAALG